LLKNVLDVIHLPLDGSTQVGLALDTVDTFFLNGFILSKLGNVGGLGLDLADIILNRLVMLFLLILIVAHLSALHLQDTLPHLVVMALLFHLLQLLFLLAIELVLGFFVRHLCTLRFPHVLDQQVKIDARLRSFNWRFLEVTVQLFYRHRDLTSD